MTVRAEEVAAGDVVQICMTGTIFKSVVAFLGYYGLTVDPFPVGDDDLPTFIVGVTEELLRRTQPPRGATPAGEDGLCAAASMADTGEPCPNPLDPRSDDLCTAHYEREHA